jgi:hypothetical protein
VFGPRDGGARLAEVALDPSCPKADLVVGAVEHRDRKTSGGVGEAGGGDRRRSLVPLRWWTYHLGRDLLDGDHACFLPADQDRGAQDRTWWG